MRDSKTVTEFQNSAADNGYTDIFTAIDNIINGYYNCRVHGMDLYIQSTEPTAAGDWAWINTAGLDLFG